MASVPRSDRILAQLAARTGITPCGEEWLKEALDPFHDTMLSPVGYPDTTASASVVQVVKQSYQIASPLTSTTANWDCSVVMMPWINGLNFNAATSNGGNNNPPQNYLFQQTTSTSPVIGGIQIISAASGTNLNIGQVANTAGVSANVSNTIPNQYLQGNSRVVAMAMEIVNTTSDLNRQGLITCYRIPVPQNDDGTTFTIRNNQSGDTTSFIGSADGLYIPFPPQNIAAAQLFAGTKAWAAEEGSYNVACFNTPDVPAQGLSYTMPILYNTSQTDSQVLAPNIIRQTADEIPTTAGFGAAPSVSWTEFDMSGSYFTGLSGSTTLTVNYIVYIERFPTQDDLDLIVSAKRSPEYDIRALEAYSIISQSLPVAVPFRENGLGDWFKGAVNLAASVLPMIPHPIARGLGVAAQAAAGYMNSFDQPASDVRAPGVPDAPPMTSRMRTEPTGSSLKKQRKKLKKVVTRENKFENRVRNELKGVGKVVRGKNAPRAPRMRK